MSTNGKGSSPRNLGPKFRENYDRIFRTVTSADWKREVKRARSTRNIVSEKLQKAALSVRGGSYNTQRCAHSVKPIQMLDAG